MVKVGIFGTGDVGRALGTGLIGKGHEIMLGGREATNEKATKWVSENGDKAKYGTFEDAAKFGEIIIIATLWTGTENAIKSAKPETLKGKVVIDATNPLNFGPTGPSLAVGHITSGGEIVQSWLPESKVVKCFNIVGNMHMIDPKFPGGPPDMWIAGNDAEAKKAVTEILKTIGWSVIDTGDITGSRLLEPMCLLIVRYMMSSGNFNCAWKLLRK